MNNDFVRKVCVKQILPGKRQIVPFAPLSKSALYFPPGVFPGYLDTIHSTDQAVTQRRISTL